MKKKILITTFALITALALGACGDTNTASASADNKTVSVAEKTEDVKTESEKTDPAPEASVSEPEPEPAPAPAIPEGYEEVDIESTYYGVKISFAGLNDGRFVEREDKVNQANLKLGKTDIDVKYISDSEWRNKDYLSYSFQIYPDDGSRLERDLKDGIAIEDSAYTAYLTDEIEENKCKVVFMTDENSYIDGRMRVEVDMVAYKGFMSAEDFKAAAETFIDTLTIELVPDNLLNDQNGDFASYSGVYTVPAKLTIAGKELDNVWTIDGKRARAMVSFTADDGDEIVIMEEGKNVPKYVSSRYDDADHYRQVQFGDWYGICDMDTSYGNMCAEYTIVFEKDGDNETNMTFSVTKGTKSEYSSQQLREIFSDDAQVADLNALLDSFAEEYLSQIVYNGTGE